MYPGKYLHILEAKESPPLAALLLFDKMSHRKSYMVISGFVLCGHNSTAFTLVWDVPLSGLGALRLPTTSWPSNEMPHVAMSQSDRNAGIPSSLRKGVLTLSSFTLCYQAATSRGMDDGDLTDGQGQTKASILVTVAAVHALLLMSIGSRCRHHRHRVIRFFLWGASVAYFPLISYVLSYFTTFLSSLRNDLTWLVLMSIVLIQFLKDKADKAALSMAAVTSPAASDDDINSLKIRPSMESLISAFWAAGLVIYNISDDIHEYSFKSLDGIVALLWALGASRMVLGFVAFQRATSSFSFGRNVQLIDGYMEQLHLQQECARDRAAVPRLIVTGEMNKDVEEKPQGYRVIDSALHDKNSSLVTLDRVWSESDPILVPKLKDLCLSFALFKCLRRRFAGSQLAEAGSDWAFRFVSEGLLGQEGEHERIFQVIATELTFATDFYYSPLPVAALGTLPAAIHFLLSFIIFASLFAFTLALLVIIQVLVVEDEIYYLPLLVLVLPLIIISTEISEMVAGVRSNWTKISIIGHYIRCQSCCVRRIFSCLLRCKPPKHHWTDEIRQVELLMKPSLSSEHSCFKSLFFPWKNGHKPVIKVAPAVKAAILCSLKGSSGQLSFGTVAVQRRCQSDISWACCGGDQVATTTDAILIWCIATSLFDIRFSSRRASTAKDRKLVALSLSCYCTYLVAKAPHLLPDNSAWTKLRYTAVQEIIDAASSHGSAVLDEGTYYQHLVHSFGSQTSEQGEVLKKGSRLGKQLVEEAERPRSGDGDAGGASAAVGEDAVWELLAEFWSEMVLYLAPSDNVKGHIEALQRRGELITLLWALLLHSGITCRPARPRQVAVP